MYFSSTRMQSKSDVWLIDLDASFHMTPHREWFYECEKYNAGDVFLGHGLRAKIKRHGRVKLLLKYGRIKTLASVLQIPHISKNLISINRRGDASVYTILEKERCKIV